MTDIQKYARSLLAVGVAGALLLTGGVASAKLDLCQQQINIHATLYESAITKALQGCENAVRKEQVKNAVRSGTGSIANAAKLCETLLSRVYGAPSSPKPFIGKTAVQKFKERWATFRTGVCKVGGTPCTANAQCAGAGNSCSAKCTDEDLSSTEGMVHLPSGAAGYAPPSVGDAGKFTCDWILIAKEKLAIQQQLFLTPDTLTLLNTLVSAAPESINPATGIAAKKGTNCSAVGFNPDTEEHRPNLCRFGIECREHACELDSAQSNATLVSAHLNDVLGGPQALGISGRLALGMCKLGGNHGVCRDAPYPPCTTDADCPASPTRRCNFSNGQGLGGELGAEPGFLYLVNGPARTLKVAVSPGLMSFPGWEAVCIDQVRSEGWCDCTGSSGVLKNTNFCIDQRTGDNAGPNDDCGSSLTLKTPSPLYSGTFNGALRVTRGGPSLSGDCVDLNTMQFKFVLSGHAGADGTDCTNDDFAAPSAPASVLLTTGTATAAVKDAVESPGTCNLSGDFCIEDANCNYCAGHCSTHQTETCLVDADCPGGETCTSPLGKRCTANGDCGTGGVCVTTDTCLGASLIDIALGPITGSRTSCTNYETGNLSGLKLVGTFPALATDFTSPLGDSVTGFQFTCQSAPTSTATPTRTPTATRTRTPTP